MSYLAGRIPWPRNQEVLSEYKLVVPIALVHGARERALVEVSRSLQIAEIRRNVIDVIRRRGMLVVLMRWCKVSVTDAKGRRHSVDVQGGELVRRRTPVCGRGEKRTASGCRNRRSGPCLTSKRQARCFALLAPLGGAE